MHNARTAKHFRHLASKTKYSISAGGLLLALLMMGCGGGGGTGGSSRSKFLGRSYYYGAGEQFFGLTVDVTGRFTCVVRDPSSFRDTVPRAAQGFVSTTGTFAVQTTDPQVQVEGTFATNGESLAFTVRSGTTALFGGSADVVPAASTTSALVGSYGASGMTDSAYVTVDLSGHASIFVDVSSGTGGGFADMQSDGSFATYGADMAGKLDVLRSDPILVLTRLNNAAVSIEIPLRSAARTRWTFMVYLNAANDLQQFGPLNVNQMEKIGSNADINIVVQWKQANCSSCGSPAWVSTRRYFINRDGDTNRVTSPIVEDLGPNIDMGDWRTLYAFVSWAQRKYPAEHYALVIWNHGAGWRSTRAGIPALLRSVSIDDDTGNEIATWELPQALNVSPKPDLLIFDASLMQMLEVAYEVRNAAAIMVGSEESPPGEGYVYDMFLADLALNPNMSPAEFATSIVGRTLESYGANSNITQSALDLSRIQTVAERLDAFARLLIFYGPTYSAKFVTARKNVESYLYRDNKDLWHYAELVRTSGVPSDLQSAAQNLEAAIQSAVIAEAHGSLHPNSHGVAVYIPEPASYLMSYANLALSRVTQWDEWLRAQPAR